MLSHFLIGVAGVGKSTFAQLIAQTGNYQIISTDAIREQLYGDQLVQGSWPEIEVEVLTQIEKAIASSTPVIYDATNAVKPWRVELLDKIKARIGQEHQWLGWHLDLPLHLAQAWNQQRKRKVPENIIEKMAENLDQFPPILTEGFCQIYTITDINNYNLAYIAEKIKSLS